MAESSFNSGDAPEVVDTVGAGLWESCAVVLSLYTVLRLWMLSQKNSSKIAVEELWSLQISEHRWKKYKD